MADTSSPFRRRELTPVQVRRIREAKAMGVPMGELAKRFGVGIDVVRQAAKGVEVPRLLVKVDAPWGFAPRTGRDR